MSGYTFEKKISLGNIIQILLLAFALIGGYFGMKASIDANTTVIKANSEAISQMQGETQGLDVLTYKVDANAKTLARIESKLDE